MTTTLPGLPTAPDPVGPGNDGDPNISEIEAATINLRTANMEYLMAWFGRERDEGRAPNSGNACRFLLLQTISALAEVTDPGRVRMALLVALLDTYEKAPSFIEIGKLKGALDTAAAAHRAAPTITPGGIILPPTA